MYSILPNTSLLQESLTLENLLLLLTSLLGEVRVLPNNFWAVNPLGTTPVSNGSPLADIFVAIQKPDEIKDFHKKLSKQFETNTAIK